VASAFNAFLPELAHIFEHDIIKKMYSYMSANCLNLQYSVISISFVTDRHALLASALQMARQIELNRNLILFALLGQMDSPTESIEIHLIQLYPALLPLLVS